MPKPGFTEATFNLNDYVRVKITQRLIDRLKTENRVMQMIVDNKFATWDELLDCHVPGWREGEVRMQFHRYLEFLAPLTDSPCAYGPNLTVEIPIPGVTYVQYALQRLAICSCGYTTLHDAIPLGTVYDVDIQSRRAGTLTCGGCGKKQSVTIVWVADRGESKGGWFPIDLFVAQVKPEGQA